MNPRNRPIIRVIAFATMLVMVLCGCSKEATPTSSAPAASRANMQTAAQVAMKTPEEDPIIIRDYDTISVAVYPYIPDVPLFEELLASYWAEIEPDVTLEFVAWDAYAGDDATGIDIVMYDALFTSHLAENGFIQPINLSDIQYENEKRILPFAVDGAIYNDKLYGIPFFMCSNFLIHKSDDAELAEVDNFAELYTLISERQAEDENAGLITDFKTNVPYFFLDALIDFAGEYSQYPEIPETATLDEGIEELYSHLKSMLAPEKEIEDEDIWNAFSAAFSTGHGTAYYGYSEDMCDMDNLVDNLTIRTISFSETENIPMFFTDIASIGAHVEDPQKLADCKKILRIIGSKEFQLELCLAGEEPQYILPARQSAYADLKEVYPMYGNLHKLVVNETNKVNRFGPDIYTYFTNAANDLKF